MSECFRIPIAVIVFPRVPPIYISEVPRPKIKYLMSQIFIPRSARIGPQGRYEI